VVLVNAQHTKNVPGRKTDVQECQWLMKLHTYGLLRDSFRLAQEMERVRTIWRLRDWHVKEACALALKSPARKRLRSTSLEGLASTHESTILTLLLIFFMHDSRAGLVLK
jgi:hypothetical protein